MFTARVTETYGAPAAVRSQYLIERRVNLIGSSEPVFQVRDRGTGLRLWVRSTSDAPGSTERLRGEAQILSRISHPHILGLQADCTVADDPYLLYPWRGERPISDIGISDIPPTDRARACTALLSAIQYLQSSENNIAHTALDLENLWVTEGVYWLLLTGFCQAQSNAEKEQLLADRAATIRLIAQLHNGDSGVTELDGELAEQGTAWIQDDPDSGQNFSNALKRKMLDFITTDL